MAEAKDDSSGRDLKVLLVGKTGSGKSKTGNSILQLTPKTDGFETAGYSGSITKNCKVVTNTVLGRKITVIDTPGSIDTKNPRRAKKEIEKYLQESGGIDAFLLITRYPLRLTPEERKVIEDAKRQYGEKFGMYTVVVVTGGDTYENEEGENGTNRPFEEFLREDARINQKQCLSNVLGEFKTYMIFNNFPRDHEIMQKQLKELFAKIDLVINAQGNSQFNKNDDDCFPTEAMLCKFPGKGIGISKIVSGDLVLCMDSNNQSIFQEVYMIGHSDPDSMMEVAEIKTQNHLLKVSANHYLPVGHVNTYKFAANVKVGDILFVTDKDNKIYKEEVISVNYSVAVGKYNIFTPSGTLIVDGIVATCYEKHLQPKFANVAMFPLRCLYRMNSAWLEHLNRNKKNGIPTWIWYFKKLLE